MALKESNFNESRVRGTLPHPTSSISLMLQAELLAGLLALPCKYNRMPCSLGVPDELCHCFCPSQGYEVLMFDSLVNRTAYLGNTTENFFKVSNLKIGHNYSFAVRARCLYGGQMCGEPATLLYDELGAGKSLAQPPLPP